MDRTNKWESTAEINKEIEFIQTQLETTTLLAENSLREAKHYTVKAQTLRNQITELERRQKDKRSTRKNQSIYLSPNLGSTERILTKKRDRNKNLIYIRDIVRINVSRTVRFTGKSKGIVTHLTKKGLLSIKVEGVETNTTRFPNQVEKIEKRHPDLK
jgi:hypothetical protein